MIRIRKDLNEKKDLEKEKWEEKEFSTWHSRAKLMSLWKSGRIHIYTVYWGSFFGVVFPYLNPQRNTPVLFSSCLLFTSLNNAAGKFLRRAEPTANWRPYLPQVLLARFRWGRELEEIGKRFQPRTDESFSRTILRSYEESSVNCVDGKVLFF